MQFIRGIHNLGPEHRGSVATIGNFDGVHLGHQAVLQQLVDRSRDLECPTAAIIFEPQPAEFFGQRSAPPRLTPLRDKVEALSRYGVERVLCVNFNRRFADYSPDRFIRELLVNGLGVRHLVVGEDFRFGFRRQGGFDDLVAAGAEYGFEVQRMPEVELDGRRVSSSWIRECLTEGDMETAERLLGRPYRISGRVVRGDERGRTIGFPTANILLKHRAISLKGVFAVEAFGAGDRPLEGVANLGVRPTVGGTRTVLEVHLLDFVGDIYREHLKVDFLTRLREEQRFESLDALKEQINRDVEQARAFFETRRHPGSDLAF